MRDLDFLLHEVFGVEELCELPRYRDHDRQIFDQAIDAAARLAREDGLV